MVLCSALLRNRQEGHKGHYYGTDLNSKAGYLLRESYAEVGQILYGDSVESLRNLKGTIDLFINDSDHSADHESQEYETVAGKLSPGAVILGDNSYATDRLIKFSHATGRKFLFWKEEPMDHWYPGWGNRLKLEIRRQASTCSAILDDRIPSMDESKVRHDTLHRITLIAAISVPSASVGLFQLFERPSEPFLRRLLSKASN